MTFYRVKYYQDGKLAGQVTAGASAARSPIEFFRKRWAGIVKLFGLEPDTLDPPSVGAGGFFHSTHPGAVFTVERVRDGL